MPALLPTYAPFPFVMAQAVGERIVAEDGRVFLDFYGGHCVASTGHSHPAVVAAIQAQAAKLLFYSTAGDLRIRHQAAERLIDFAGGSGMASVFFCNSGAEANENALKIAKKATGRRQIVCFSGGWHGRALSCLAATDDPKITQPYGDWLPPAQRLPFNDLAALDAQDWSDVAAVIVEPVQSLSGIRVAASDWLQALRGHCQRQGVVLIFDEIQTGVGRLGSPFAANHFAVCPDIITSAKGLASGVPIGAVLLSDALAQNIAPGDLGSTFGAGPLAMAALLATLDVIVSERLMPRCLLLQTRLADGLQGSAVRALRGLGLLLGMQTPVANALKQHLFDAGILVGGAAAPDVLRLMPPLTLSDQAVAQLILAIQAFEA